MADPKPTADVDPSILEDVRRRIRRLPVAERERARELLGLPRRGGQLQPTGEREHLWHENRPRELVEFFGRALAEVARLEAERVVTSSGRVEWPVRPTAPPTLNQFAASIGASRRCLARWAARYPEFREAMERAKAVQAACTEKLAAIGALAAPTASILLRHLAEMVDKVEVEVGVKSGLYPVPGGPLAPDLDPETPIIDLVPLPPDDPRLLAREGGGKETHG